VFPCGFHGHTILLSFSMRKGAHDDGRTGERQTECNKKNTGEYDVYVHRRSQIAKSQRQTAGNEIIERPCERKGAHDDGRTGERGRRQTEYNKKYGRIRRARAEALTMMDGKNEADRVQ